MTGDISREEAGAALARADESARRVRSQARWMSTYLGVFSAGFGGLTLLLGLVEPLALRMTVVSVAWGLLVSGMVVWALRRPAGLRGTARRVTPYWLGTCGLYAVALFLGTPGRIGEPLYWIPAALIVAAPLAIGALRERRA